MKKVFKIVSVVIIFLFLLLMSNILLNNKYKAVYLVPEKGGHLSNADLLMHPEVKVVHNSYQLIWSTFKEKAIWIDKDSLEEIYSHYNINITWLNIYPAKYYPLVLVGYNDTLYSFRDCLPIGLTLGKFVDWKKVRLEPGFSIKSQKGNGFLKGYDQSYDVEDILNKTNSLLDGKITS